MSLEHAILGFVNERARSGYDLKKAFDATVAHIWPAKQSQIYLTLARLNKAGLIELRVVQQDGKPNRKVYHITRAGEGALRASVLDALSTPRRCHSPLQLGLANLPRISQAEALAGLSQYHDALAAELERVEATRESQQPLPYFVDALFSHSITIIEAELKWITQFMSQLAEQADQ